jgi:hypothetical protein
MEWRKFDLFYIKKIKKRYFTKWKYNLHVLDGNIWLLGQHFCHDDLLYGKRKTFTISNVIIINLQSYCISIRNNIFDNPFIIYFSTLNVDAYNFKSISCCLSIIIMHLYDAYYNLDNYDVHVRSTSFGHDGKNWWHDITIFIKLLNKYHYSFR